MKTVQTVLGDVKTEDLGSVLMHEHVCTSSMGVALSYPQLYGKNFEQQILSDLKEMKENGIATVVDASPVTLGRDVKELKKVSGISGVNIIATTGWWGCEPPYLGPSTAEQWAQCFADDINKGCDGTDIKAGIFKASRDKEGPTEWVRKMHHAVGMAQRETGKKIMLHTYCPTETPRHQLKILREEGVDMNDVVVDHIPETTDIDFVRWIYDQGAWIGVDRMPIISFPGEYAVGTETRIKFVKTMLDAGMGDRMLFSHDIMCASTLYDNQPEEIYREVWSVCPERFLFIKNRLFKELAEMGCDPAYLWSLTIDNPRKFFEG